MSRVGLIAAVAFALVGSACAAATGDPTPGAPEAATPGAGGGQVSVPEPPERPEGVDVVPAATPIPLRAVTEQAWTPFAVVGGVTLVHPSARVERVAFHEANHDGARQLEILPTAVGPVTLETRERGTGSRSAVDVVVDPEVEIRAPVTGTVKRAGTYVLYCEYSDDFAVIEPDAHPGWEVKILHIDGVQVRAGQWVAAGQTVLADRPTRLPFESQVDELYPSDHWPSDHWPSDPWPHVHLEVVDPSIPNRPSGRGCD